MKRDYKTITSRNSKKISSLALHVLLILAVLGLGADMALKMTTGGGICPTESCEIVGDYIRISELGLVSLGLVFFILLWGVYFFASRYDKKPLWTGVLLLILGALAFDGAILGFQFFSIKEQCHLCIGVGAALLLVLLLFALNRRKAGILILGLGVWIGGGVAGAMISIPDRAPLLERMSGITWSGQQASEWPRFYYFFSLHCPHCTDVLVNLAVNEPKDYSWTLFPLDTSPADLKKIAWVMDLNARDYNIFYEIVRLEQSRQVPEIEVPEDLVQQIHMIRSYFRANGFSGVPLMIVDESSSRRLILTGGSTILDYLYAQGILDN